MSKYDLTFDPPLLNAAGSLGFAPSPHGPFDLSRLGAFVTNPISRKRRVPALSRSCLSFPGGFLLHSGYPNPGMNRAVRQYAARWRRSPIPVIVHLLPDVPTDTQGTGPEFGTELANMVARLETLEGVAGIELGIPPDCPAPAARQIAVAAQGELPLIVRLPLERAGELAEALGAESAYAFSLGPPRGTLAGPDGRLVNGRLYGPGLFPQALAGVRRLAGMGLRVIGGGGIFNERQADTMLSAGAIAIQVDAVLWRLGWAALRGSFDRGSAF
jgi:dihydroorotate dehydrogenase (NAD+) catalytic subunit